MAFVAPLIELRSPPARKRATAIRLGGDERVGGVHFYRVFNADLLQDRR